MNEGKIASQLPPDSAPFSGQFSPQEFRSVMATANQRRLLLATVVVGIALNAIALSSGQESFTNPQSCYSVRRSRYMCSREGFLPPRRLGDMQESLSLATWELNKSCEPTRYALRP